MAMNLGLDPRDPDYQRKLAAMVRQGGVQPGMMPPGMASSGFAEEATAGRMQPEQGPIPDFTGQERKIKNQRDYANSLRGNGPAKGKTVGPLGVYMAPNWGESLAAAGSEVLGGYLSGKADRADEALGEQRGLEKTRVADIEAAETANRERQAQDRIDNQAAQFDAREAAAAAREETRAAETEADRDARNKREEATIARAEAARVESLRRHEASQKASEEAAVRADKRLDQADQRLENVETKAATAAEKTMNAGATKIGTEIGKAGIPQADANMSQLGKLIGDYAEQDENGRWVMKEGVTEIPGIGGVSNAPLGIGEAVTWGADALRDNDEEEGIGKSIKQSAQKVYNTEIKDLSGSAVSAHEMLRNLRSQGTDIWSGGQNFLDGINAISDGYSEKEQQILGNADPEHLAVYLERQAQQAGGGEPAAGGLSSMTEEEFLLLSEEDQAKVLAGES